MVTISSELLARNILREILLAKFCVGAVLYEGSQRVVNFVTQCGVSFRYRHPDFFLEKRIADFERGVGFTASSATNLSVTQASTYRL